MNTRDESLEIINSFVKNKVGAGLTKGGFSAEKSSLIIDTIEQLFKPKALNTDNTVADSDENTNATNNEVIDSATQSQIYNFIVEIIDSNEDNYSHEVRYVIDRTIGLKKSIGMAIKKIRSLLTPSLSKDDVNNVIKLIGTLCSQHPTTLQKDPAPQPEINQFVHQMLSLWIKDNMPDDNMGLGGMIDNVFDESKKDKPLHERLNEKQKSTILDLVVNFVLRAAQVVLNFLEPLIGKITLRDVGMSAVKMTGAHVVNSTKNTVKNFFSTVFNGIKNWFSPKEEANTTTPTAAEPAPSMAAATATHTTTTPEPTPMSSMPLRSNHPLGETVYNGVASAGRRLFSMFSNNRAAAPAPAVIVENTTTHSPRQ